MYERVHPVSPGNGVSLHQLRLIQCFSHQGGSSSLGAGSGAGGCVHGRWEEGRTAVATKTTGGQRALGGVSRYWVCITACSSSR